MAAGTERLLSGVYSRQSHNKLTLELEHTVGGRERVNGKINGKMLTFILWIAANEAGSA